MIYTTQPCETFLCVKKSVFVLSLLAPLEEEAASFSTQTEGNDYWSDLIYETSLLSTLSGAVLPRQPSAHL